MKLAFRRVAIVNRGEPAIRFLHAARELNEECASGIHTIAVYTEPDRRTMFVRESDEGVCLGPATFVDPKDGQRKSKYLDYAALERALVSTRAQAVWVGWGFVAEHAEFAELCKRLGVVFIGPTAEAMRSVGDKIASKRLAESANVPVAPWSGGPIVTTEEAVAIAAKLGFPLMIKATAGGGGRGVRRVKSNEELQNALTSARSEALKFFGDETVFIEKAIAPARHIEVQVLADTHGACWPVGIRDCTIQRRNQKVLEEAPSPALDAALEDAFKTAAVRVAKAAGYTNAGTVEFLFDPDKRSFYFMEMNTRLQVEHPVTEATTGLDLVKMQLFVASGGKLEGEPPKTVGHAIEVRLNAEDAENQFAPAPGTIELFRLPTGPGLRVDTGVRGGDVIAPDFDSMIAKIIAFGNTREEALSRLRRALAESAIVIRGGMSNKGFLLELLSHPEVVQSKVDIGWLDRTWGKDGGTSRPHADIALVQAALDVYEAEFSLEQKNFFVSASRGRPVTRAEIGKSIELSYAGQMYKLDTRRVGPNEYRIVVDGERIDVAVDRHSHFERWLTCRDVRHRVVSVVDGTRHLVEVDGIPYRVSRDDGGVLRAPAPAVVLAIHAKAGDSVAPGDPLVILEAMKMETAVLAPCRGRVRKVLVRPNVQVVAGAPLLLLDPEGGVEQTSTSSRVAFGPEAPPSELTSATYLQSIREVRRMMLGYDIDPKDSVRIRKTWTAARGKLPVADDEAWNAELEVLKIFTDLLVIYHDEPAGGPDRQLSGLETLHAYLRAVNLAGKGLPAAFVENLKRALSHYGITSLEPSVDLDQTLVFAHKASRRVDECAPHAFAVLDGWVKQADALLDRATPDLRLVLDRLIRVTRDRNLPVHDVAHQARFCFFERKAIEADQQEGYRQIKASITRIVELPAGGARDKGIDALVGSPHALQGHLMAALEQDNRPVRRLLVEAILRRFYRIRRLSHLTFEETGGYCVLSADYEEKGTVAHVVATHSTPDTLEAAAQAAAGVLAKFSKSESVALDLYVAYDADAVDVEGFRQTIARTLTKLRLERTLSYVCVVLLGAGRSNPLRSLTFVPAESGYREHELHPGMHPMLAERLEVWRLSNFKLEQLPAPGQVYLFRAVARNNPKDERLFAFVDVRDATPRRDEHGQLLGLPHVEHLFLEAVIAMRQIQARRSTKDRLHWNRILLFLWSGADISVSEMARVAKRLAPAAKNLGLEKAVIRARVRDDRGEMVDRVLHVSNRTGTGLRIQFDEISDAPVRPLTTYAQRVIQLRRLSLLYPYEIVRMLTPEKTRAHAEFPPGEFIEYDLDDARALVPVTRPHGENRANVVVGLIRNYTAKHPEGMARVIILSDPSREMGALADPECTRIIAAFDLAEQMKIPVDWFPVSSGAKIAMDVGTEGLDAVARVLRRVIEFTQRGGAANVIVTGVNVGAQSYWDAEATMLMHTKGILIMTPQGSMVLTGKRALDYSGGVSADTNQGIGGFERIMGPNGQAQYWANDVAEACHILFRHYEHTYVAPGERFPRRAPTTDASTRNIELEPHAAVNGTGFDAVGDVFSNEKNPGRKKPFDIRSVMHAVVDKDHAPFERWLMMRDAETAVTWDAHLGGLPISLIGIESKPLSRTAPVPADGPETWTGGTLFPQSSKKVARAINASSGNRPVVVLANLSGFDGSPESMYRLQLEYGAEIGRAVVNFDGPMVFSVISRYHGGAYVVFSCTLNDNLHVVAVEGSHASVIGGAPAAAVVFPAEVKARTVADPRVKELEKELASASEANKSRLLAQFDETFKQVFSEKQGEVAEYFDKVHSVQRALAVGSLHGIVPAANLRGYLIDAVQRGMAKVLSSAGTAPKR